MCNEHLLVAEADHRIANHLALLTSYVRLKSGDLARQATEPSRASVQLLLDGLGVQLEAVARLHRALAVEGPTTTVDLSEHLHETCAPYRLGLSGEVDIIEDFAPRCLVRTDQVLALTQIFAEVLTNAVKYARPGGAGMILARCRRGAAGDTVVEVIDDGPGLPKGFDVQSDGGLGFRLLRALGKQLGGAMLFDSAATGLRFQITLPATPA